MKEIIITKQNNIINLSGNITFNNIMQVFNVYEKLTEDTKKIKINLKELSNFNSSTIVFIINCIRSTKKKKQIITFINMPNLLIKLTKIYNLNSIIPVCN